MSQRITRLNGIVANELNAILHTLFRDAAKQISITEAVVSPDLHDAYIYFSVVGDGNDIDAAERFLRKRSAILRHKLFNRVQLRHSPRLNFRYDDSQARGRHVLAILDNMIR